MATVELSSLILPTAAIGTDPLPPLRFTRDLHAAVSTSGVDPEMAANLAYGHVSSILPYLLQSTYGRTLTEVEHPVAVLANERLRATFLLSRGGRLWSLVDTTTGRNLLYSNAALQPGNLPLRDAWFAGGVEWNLGTTGHHPLTCELLHAARLTADDGTPVLRLWEFERLRELVVQLDAWLPDGADALSVQVSVTNVNAHDVPLYWWSNIAVPQADGVRVLAPADAGYRFDHTRVLRRVPIPVDGGLDRSYPTRSPTAVDYFFDLDRPDDGIARGEPVRRPWIAAVDADGYGLLHTSTARLRGRKLFVWGTGSGGRHWQRWLSPRGGEYLEIQAGIARTQLEHVPLPPGTRWSWLETYGPVRLAAAHADWPVAVAAAQHAVAATAGAFAAQRRAAAALVDRPIEQRLQRGSGWGALETRRRDLDGEPTPGTPAAPFDPDDLGHVQEPWLALLAGRPVPWSGSNPASYQVAPGWHRRLEQGTGAWAALHRGVARFAAGDRTGALDAWEESLRMTPSVVGWRNIAAAVHDDDPSRALRAYREARRLGPAETSVVIEQLDLMLALGHVDSALAEIDLLPAAVRTEPRVQLVKARAAVAGGDVARAGRILEPGLVLPGLREGAAALGELWVDYRSLLVGRRAAAAEDLPDAYDFRMA